MASFSHEAGEGFRQGRAKVARAFRRMTLALK
jgi:hypothetical protein